MGNVQSMCLAGNNSWMRNVNFECENRKKDSVHAKEMHVRNN